MAHLISSPVNLATSRKESKATQALLKKRLKSSGPTSFPTPRKYLKLRQTNKRCKVRSILKTPRSNKKKTKGKFKMTIYHKRLIICRTSKDLCLGQKIRWSSNKIHNSHLCNNKFLMVTIKLSSQQTRYLRGSKLLYRIKICKTQSIKT